MSCSNDSVNPVTSTDNHNENISLAKRSWNTSQIYDWSTNTFYDELYDDSVTTSNLSFGTYFYNNNYHLQYSRVSNGNGFFTNTVTITVNGTYCSQIVWTNSSYSNNSRWLGWHSFYYNGTLMQINLFVLEHLIPQQVYSEPRQVQIQVEEKYLEIPTGFSVSPSVHNNYNQVVTLTWDPSTDTDVTGYEIYRMRYYLKSDGQLGWTTYSLVQTIPSRTTSSWQNSPIWGANAHLGIGYYYKIRSISSTLNMQSNYTYSSGSYLEDYDYLMP